MKITQTRLKEIIKEELEAVLAEEDLEENSMMNQIKSNQIIIY